MGLPELVRAGSLTLPRLVGQTSDPIGSRTFSGNMFRRYRDAGKPFCLALHLCKPFLVDPRPVSFGSLGSIVMFGEHILKPKPALTLFAARHISFLSRTSVSVE